MYDSEINPEGLPVIATARTQKAINKAAKNGYLPLIRKVEPSKSIRSKYAIFQHRVTGEIEVSGDFRLEFSDHEEYKKVVDWTWYYPYSFPAPYAAYLIPKDLQPGQKVWIDDLIEDLISSHWNQGDTTRLMGCEGIWTGEDLEINYDPKNNISTVIG